MRVALWLAFAGAPAVACASTSRPIAWQVARGACEIVLGIDERGEPFALSLDDAGTAVEPVPVMELDERQAATMAGIHAGPQAAE